MANVIAPPSATDTVVLSLLNMFSDPEGAKKQIKDYNDARVAAENAMKRAADASSLNTKEAERLAELAAHLNSREATIKAYEADITERLHQMDGREKDHAAAIRAHDSAVKQANTDAAARDSELGRREQALKDREAKAAAMHDAAEATRNKHQDALDKMRAAVA